MSNTACVRLCHLQASVAAVLLSLLGGADKGARVALLPGGCSAAPITPEGAEAAIRAACGGGPGGVLRGLQVKRIGVRLCFFP